MANPKIILIFVVVITLIGLISAGVFVVPQVLNENGKTAVQQTEKSNGPASPESSVPLPQYSNPYTNTNSSDAQLDKDLKTYNDKLDGLNTDESGIEQGLNQPSNSVVIQ